MKEYLNIFFVFILTILLSGCGSGDDINPSNTTTNPEAVISSNSITVKGQIEGWNQANKMLTAYTSNIGQPEDQKSISSNGNFSILVNQPSDLSKGQPQAFVCNPDDPNTTQSNVSSSSATSYQLLNLVGDSIPLHLSSTKDYTNIFTVAPGATVSNVSFYYYDNASVITGEEACLRGNSQQVKVIYDLNIKVGWNMIALTATNQNGLLTISGKTGSIPNNVSWFARN